MILGTILILLLAALLLWFGWQVEVGQRRPKPHDAFFPLFGRNVDYILGASGLLAGIGVLCIVVGFWIGQTIVVIWGVAMIGAGFVRAYLSPRTFGPRWVRRQK